MPVSLTKIFPISKTFAVQCQVTVFHDGEMCSDAIDLDNEAVNAERARVNAERQKRRDTQEENIDVPPVVDLKEFLHIFNYESVVVGLNEPNADGTDPEQYQAHIHIQSKPTYYVSLAGSDEWRVVDLAEVLRREAKSRVNAIRDEVFSITGGVNEPRIEIDRVRHIIPQGVSKILYNTTPNAKNPTWEALDVLVDHKAMIEELEEKRRKVAALENTVLQLRAALDTQIPPRTDVSSEELASREDGLSV